ncbi:hypothetical protein AN958_03327 [Leucoagaricus sp. SymC.cos]|nr:hypothetical protein AN958_03327 [Leucoagaricus sp. SymC.cos]
MQRITTEGSPGASRNQDDYCEVPLEAGTAGEIFGCMSLPPQTQPLSVNAQVRDGDNADKGKGKEGETVKMYSIRARETMGLGMFARKDLSAGELVVAERPLMIIPKTPVRIEMSTDEASLGQIDNEELENLRLDTFETVMQAHLETTLPRRQTQFLALSASPPAVAKGQKERLLWNRIQANAVAVPSQPVRSTVLENGEKLIGEVPQNYLAVCNDISRVNHSCTPNVALSFDTKSWSFQLHTLRDVSAGTEVVISYVPIFLPLGERSNILGSRDIVCQCTGCFLPSSYSIHFRASFAQEVAILETSYRLWMRYSSPRYTDSGSSTRPP